MHLITPSGASHTLSAGFAERGSRYRAAVRWWEVGRHEIIATINGDPVVGSPLIVEAWGHTLHTIPTLSSFTYLNLSTHESWD